MVAVAAAMETVAEEVETQTLRGVAHSPGKDPLGVVMDLMGAKTDPMGPEMDQMGTKMVTMEAIMATMGTEMDPTMADVVLGAAARATEEASEQSSGGNLR